jgi:hypothetical protein
LKPPTSNEEAEDDAYLTSSEGEAELMIIEEAAVKHQQVSIH